MQKTDEGMFKPIISRTLLKWCFVFSKMTVLDDQKEEESSRYHYIKFVEFVEMVCRVAIRVYPDNGGKGRSTPVHVKVEHLLK